MLKAASVTMHLTPADLESALSAHTAGRAKSVKVTVVEGALLLSLNVAPEALPLTVPVNLRFTVDSVRDTTVELAVIWTNFGLVPESLKEQVLRKAFEALPGHYDQGRYAVDVTELVDYVPVAFRIESIAFHPDRAEVALADLSVSPLQVNAVLEDGPFGAVPAPAVGEADPEGHQSYYQRLRERVARFTAEKAPDWAKPLMPWLLAAPDFFVLLVRLARDHRVPASAKLIAGVAVAYFISPVDLIFDMIPVVGHVDDLSLALLAIEQIARRVPAPVVQEHWPGDGQVLEWVSEGSRRFGMALPGRLLAALKRRLVRK